MRAFMDEAPPIVQHILRCLTLSPQYVRLALRRAAHPARKSTLQIFHAHVRDEPGQGS